MKMFNKKNLLLYLLVLAILVTSCGLNKEKKQPVLITLNENQRSILNAPLYIGVSQNIFKKEGLTLKLKTGINKTADINLIDLKKVLALHNQEQVLVFAQLTQKDGSFFISREIESTFTWPDTKKKIIIGKELGTISEIFLEHILRQNELLPQKSVDIIQNIPPGVDVGAFKGGVGHFLLTDEPNASILESQNAGKVVASLGNTVGVVPYSVFSTDITYIKENSQAVQKFTNALYKAQLWFNQHTASEIAKEIKPFFSNIEFAILVKAISRYKDQNTWSATPIINQSSFARFQEIVINAGELTQKIPFEAIVNNSFAKKSFENIQLPEKKKN